MIKLDREYCNQPWIAEPYTPEEQDFCLGVVNGVIIAMRNKGFGWREGYRNTMAVDFTIAAQALNLDPVKTFEQFFDKELSLESKEDAVQRIKTVAGYEYAKNSDWKDYMLDPQEWIDWSDYYEDHAYCFMD